MHKRAIHVLVLLLATTLLLAACDRGGDDGDGEENGEQASGNLFDEVVERGTLRCGVNETVPGFGFATEGGEIEGFDIDFCRAFAAAILGDPEAIELVPIDADFRFSALRSGEYDVLVRNTTATSSREGVEGTRFAHTNFYDSQGMMVKEGTYEAIDEMDDTAICVTTGTTTELNLADYFAERDLDYEPIAFEENPQLQEAFISGRCDAWTSDRSQLAGIISQWPENEGGPESMVILPEIMSKEPLSPGVLKDEIELYDAIHWTVNGLIQAEELGVTQENVEDMAANPPNANVAYLLGAEFEDGAPLDHGLPVENDFMQDVLLAVGNYGEIYERHVGSQGLGLERGLNALWTDGGLQYAWPFR